MLPDLQETIRSNLANSLDKADNISFTTDLWTSEHNVISYMCVTAHWLTADFERYSGLLQCEKLDGSHTGILEVLKFKFVFLYF